MKKVLKVVAIIILTLLILVGLLVWGIQTPAGQNFLTLQVNSYLRKKLNPQVRIEKIRFDIPDWISLEGVFIPDYKGDTLVAGRKLRIDLDMYSLIKGNVGINAVELTDINANIYRTMPDTVFNFQYIIDAFASSEPSPADTTASTMEMRLDKIQLKNVRLSYRDAVVGTDVKTTIDSAYVAFAKFNPTKSQYHPTTIYLSNSAAELRMYASVEKETGPEKPSDPADSLDIKLGDIDVEKFKWIFTDETSGLKNGVTLDKLQGHVNQVSLASQKADVRNILVQDMKTYAEFEKRPKVKPAKETPADTAAAPGWTVRVGKIALVNNQIRYDDFNSPVLKKGLDYSHIDIKNLNINLDDFLFSDENIAGKLKAASFGDKSGFVVRELKTDFAYGEKQTYLKNLLFRTKDTRLADELILKYKNLDQLTEDIGKVQVKLTLTNSTVAFSDLLLLSPDLGKTPPFDSNPNGKLTGGGQVSGTVDNLMISKANFSMLNGTNLRMDGRISGLPNADKLSMNVHIQNLASTKADILKLLPDSTLPASIELPDNIALSGKIVGTMANLSLNTTINSSFGTAAFTGNLKNITDSLKAVYDGNLTFTNFDLGRMLKQPPEELGKLSLSMNMNGAGYAPKTMKANLDGTIQSIDVKGYVYNNLALNGSVDQGMANLKASIDDENISLKIDGKADLSKEYPSVVGDINIKNLDLTKLNLYADSLQLAGDISMDFASTSPENPLGTVNIHDLTMTHRGKAVDVDSIYINLSDTSGIKHALIRSPFLQAKMDGNFVYTEIADAVFTEVSKNFQSPDFTFTPLTKPANFTLSATLIDHPILRVFVPELTKMNPIGFKAQLDNQKDSTLIASVTVPSVTYGDIKTERVNMTVANTQDKAILNANLGLLSTGGFRMQNASLNGDIDDNNIKFKFLVKDSVNTDRHALNGDLAVNNGTYKLSLTDGMLLDYKDWKTNPAGYIEYATDSLWVKDVEISRGIQRFTVNSTSGAPNSPLQITMDSIAVSPLVALALQDTTLAAGTLGGKILLSNYTTSPIYTGDFHINNLRVMQIPVGDLSLKSTNETAKTILVETSLIGENNDVHIDGRYLLEETNALDFTMDLKRLNTKTVEAFSFGELQRGKGALSGKIQISGSTDSPKLNGAISADSVAFNVTQLGTRYSIAGQKLQFQDQQILFNKFVVTDTLNQNLTVDGKVDISKLPDVGYDMKIDTKNFTVLNASQKTNNQFFGKATIDANVSVKGVGSQSVVDGKVKVDPGSDVTFVMTNDATEAGDKTKGVIEFVDMDAPKTEDPDSTRKEEVSVDPSTAASSISMDLGIDDKSQFTLVIDELNGDNIKLKGNATLSAGIAPNGELFVLGAYDVTQGSYDITLEILKRKFLIEKGSNLIWTGDPMKADLNITASYPVMVDPASISPTLVSSQKVPINVQIIITGNLTKPNITFRVTPSDDISADLKKELTDQPFWTNMDNSAAESNRQAFALLITNRFITDQSSSFNLNTSAESIARQSVSQLLSDQLNNLASDLVKGVDLNLNLNSTADQTAGAKTDLNVGLSKAFLNNRLKIAVGKNFELENSTGATQSSEVFDNIALDYSLSKDGRYVFRAYRKNQYQSILEGFIIETGVSFIITADYNVFRELFQKQKDEN